MQNLENAQKLATLEEEVQRMRALVRIMALINRSSDYLEKNKDIELIQEIALTGSVRFEC